MDVDTARIAHGGKSVYSARIGVLMLETRFPRIPGDMGNAASWPFPVLYKVVAGASPQRVVRERAAGLLAPFRDAARELVRLGADGFVLTVDAAIGEVLVQAVQQMSDIVEQCGRDQRGRRPFPARQGGGTGPVA